MKMPYLWAAAIIAVVAAGAVAAGQHHQVVKALKRQGQRIEAVTLAVYDMRPSFERLQVSANGTQTRIDALEATNARLVAKLDALHASQANLAARMRSLPPGLKPNDLGGQAGAVDRENLRADRVADNETFRTVHGLKTASDSRLVSVQGLIDGVGLERKGGLYENYGLTVRQRRSGPITVSSTDLIVGGPRSLLVWRPQSAPPQLPSGVELVFSGTLPVQGSLTVGIELSSGDIFRFTHAFDATAAATSPLANVPPDVSRYFAAGDEPAVLLRHNNRLLGALPPKLSEALASTGDAQAVKAWFLVLDGMNGTTVSLSRAALVAPMVPSTVALRGKVVGVPIEAGAAVEVVDERNRRRIVELSPSGEFNLSAIDAHSPLSVRFRHQGEFYFSRLGRWFEPNFDRNDIEIVVAPHFVNKTSAKPDVSQSSLKLGNDPEIAARYIPHTRQRWVGYNLSPQEYDSLTFANNLGHIDVDRLGDNPSKCLRLAFAGSSFSVALQVNRSDKYNILLEEELGLRLGRCVEAIIVGRDNGDPGSLYPRLKHLVKDLKPDMLLIENSSIAMNQLSPEILRRTYGFDYESSPLDHFEYDSAGKLVFKRWEPNYGVFTTKATNEPLRAGIPLAAEPTVSFAQMTPEAAGAYKLLTDMLRLYKEEFRGTPLALFTGFDQVACRGFCQPEAKLADGTAAPYGAAQFLTNQNRVCVDVGIPCVHPDLPAGFNNTPETYLTWLNDFHLSPRGHQWLASELADKLAPTLGAMPAQAKP